MISDHSDRGASSTLDKDSSVPLMHRDLNNLRIDESVLRFSQRNEPSIKQNTVYETISVGETGIYISERGIYWHLKSKYYT